MGSGFAGFAVCHRVLRRNPLVWTRPASGPWPIKVSTTASKKRSPGSAPSTLQAAPTEPAPTCAQNALECCGSADRSRLSLTSRVITGIHTLSRGRHWGEESKKGADQQKAYRFRPSQMMAKMKTPNPRSFLTWVISSSPTHKSDMQVHMHRTSSDLNVGQNLNYCFLGQSKSKYCSESSGECRNEFSSLELS